MSEHFFAVSATLDPLPGGQEAARKRDRIAKRIDNRAGFVYYRDNADRRYRSWGFCPNRGEPFDRATAAEIQAAWIAAGV